MTIIEAITDTRFLSGELWARPDWTGVIVAWSGNTYIGGAIRCDTYGGFWYAPKTKLKERRFAPDVRSFRVPWNLVTPEQHLAELKAEEEAE